MFDREEDDETKKLAWDLDEVLSQLGLGSYQVRNFILIGLLLMFSNISPLSFTLTAGDLEYRCKVPECDKTGSTFKPSWLQYAVPYWDAEPKKCARYIPINETEIQYEECSKQVFNQSVEVSCNEWVFATNETTILNEFEIMCEDKKWQLSLVGTVNNIGQFFGIPLFGMISDKRGRKFVALLCTLVSTVFGLLRGFSSSYLMFVCFEFLDSFFSSGIYGAAFVLGLELVNPKLRPVAGTAMGTFYPVGAVLMGFIAWCVQDWRKMLLICYTPGLLFFTYYWLVPESIRWLEMNNRHKDAVRIIKKICSTNKKSLPQNAMDSIKCTIQSSTDESTSKRNNWTLLKQAFQSRSIILLVMNCSFCWFANTLVYYGLSINSVELIGNKYMNFMLVNLVEVPGFLLSGIIMDKIPRKPSQSCAFIFSGIGCIVCEFIPGNEVVLQIALFLISKFMITISFNIMYVYSAEMFPTELRLSLFGLASMFGRTGSMLAPQTTLLRQYAGKHVPVLLFGAISLVAGVLATMFPETFRKKLPDTVNEAEGVTKTSKL